MTLAEFPLVPGHTILSELGRGGMARVYLAREEQLRRLVALKVIAERFDDSDDFRRRFEREARTAAGLTHANIVPVYAYGVTEGGSPYLSMAFLDGGSLRERLRKHGPMRVEEALPVARQIASALRAAHERNVVHRDLKPDNVMFQGDNALLTDFGIAKVLDATTGLTGPGVNPGTVSYFSPEQAAGEAVDQRSDIYTLGVVLYEMLTGHLPIEARTYPAFIHRILSIEPSPLPADLGALQPFLDLLLAKDPADRLNSCGEVTAILDEMIGNWVRHRSVERIADGIVMQRSGRRAAERDLDAASERHNSAARLVDPDAATAALQRDVSEPTFALADVQTPSPIIPATDAMPTCVLHIDVNPVNAEVTVTFAGALGNEHSARWRGPPMRLPVGEAHIHARAPGYRDIRRSVRLLAGEREEVLELEAADDGGSPAGIARQAVSSPTHSNPRAAAASSTVTAVPPGIRKVHGLLVAAALLAALIGAGVYAAMDGHEPRHLEELAAESQASSVPPAQEQPQSRPLGPLEPTMVTVAPGCFQMGSEDGGLDEQPVHQVCIQRPFRMGVFEVTFDEYERFAAGTGAAHPSDEGWGRGRRPVINVSWDDANAYARWLSRETGKRFRLPTESEWEYAARAGTQTRYAWGNDASHQYANFGADACCKGFASGRDAWMNTSPVGAFEANRLGLHDVHGNVWEWVQDCYQPSYAGAPVDGAARDGASCSKRVLRGGSWLFNAPSLRSAHRYWLTPAIRDFGYGFRLAQDI